MTVRFTETLIITSIDHHGVTITDEVDLRGEDYGRDVSFYLDGELHSGYADVDQARAVIDDLLDVGEPFDYIDARREWGTMGR